MSLFRMIFFMVLLVSYPASARTTISQTLQPKACFGEYQCNRWYRMHVKKNPDACNYETPCHRWYIEKAPPVREIVLHGINFEFDKSKIREESYPILNENISVLQQEKNLRIHIIGHTDYFGTDEYNDKLSIERAQAVRDYFAQRGISNKRMTIEGRGERQPMTTDKSDLGRAQNRRIVIQF